MTLLPLEDCSNCDGSGEDTHTTLIPFVEDFSNDDYAKKYYDRYDIVDVEEEQDCLFCKGMKKVGKDGQAFKNERGLKISEGRGKARRCSNCNGTGLQVRIYYMDECYECSGNGLAIGYLKGAFEVPENVASYTHVEFHGWRQYFDDVEFVVDRSRSYQTWGEAHLGTGLGSVTDYGKMWQLEDEEVVESVREYLKTKHHLQFSAVADSKTRTLAQSIRIQLTQNGYALYAAQDRIRPPWPTYDDIIDNPVNIRI